LSRTFSPTIIPSYTSSPGETNMSARSCSVLRPNATALPETIEIITPLGRLGISPSTGR
jgi:hypothetical protein